MNEFFQCAVCFENFDTQLRVPRLLPCQHSFCSNCLPKLLIYGTRYYDLFLYRKDYSSYIECPICRAKHYTKVDDIPKSRLILNLIELTNGNQSNIQTLLNPSKLQRNTNKEDDNNNDDENRSPPNSPSLSSSSSSSSPPSSPVSSTTSSSNDLSNSCNSPPTTNNITRRIIINQQQQQQPQSQQQTTSIQISTSSPSPSPTQQQQSSSSTSSPRFYFTSSSNSTTNINNNNQTRVNIHRTQQYLNQSTNNLTTIHQRESTNQLRNQFYHPYTSSCNFNSSRSSRSQSVSYRNYDTTTTTTTTTNTNNNNRLSNHSNSNSNLSTINSNSSININTNRNISTKRISNTNRNINNTNNHRNNECQNYDWNLKNFLQSLFDDMDKNKDGSLCFDELQEALRRGQPNSEFNVKTVQLLFEKYDRNKDGEINFNGFYEMYTYLNNEYFSFLNMDKNGNGIIDADELAEAFNKRGYKFRKEFFNYIENTMRETNKNGITFDNYCRLNARFEYLANIYKNTPRYQTSHTLENYLKKHFF